MPDPEPTRKPRRFWLYAPFIILLLAAAGWTALWLQVRGQAATRMDTAVSQLRKAGYEVTWKERSLGGYPFRLEVVLTDARIREPGGWSIATPRLEAQAFLYSLGHWLTAAPEGLTLTRPVGGPVEVRGELLRASLSGLNKRPPSVSFEGRKLTFAPGAGAQPFGLSAADKVEMHLRPGPDDQGAILFKVDNGKAQLSGLFAQLAGDKPVSIVWDSILTRMSGFKGQTWPESMRAWSTGGGLIQVRQAGVTAGDALIGAQAGQLGVGYDGRLVGSMDVTLRQAPRALAAMAATGTLPPETALAAAAVAAAREDSASVARATLTFEAGRMTLGPVAIGASPRVY
ncbi:DUF2125 domain-containing protein [Phenylobacterium sp.]|uniref:DUF2125 domain-containing protein n=1 Tax=Phenylobacterium sp. TaxID=1871053 RepID=UPI00286E28AE|nr:DUF2125 domain-containing protein [Phenylobacterium sp.]